MYLVKRFWTDAEAKASGICYPNGSRAAGGDLIIVDENYKPVPGERLYNPYEQSLAEARCQELNDQDVPDLFEGIVEG